MKGNIYVRRNPIIKAIVLLDTSLSLRIVAFDGRDKQAANGPSVVYSGFSAGTCHANSCSFVNTMILIMESS